MSQHYGSACARRRRPGFGAKMNLYAICRDKLYDAMMNTNAPEYVVEFFHGYTYSDHPVACAAAVATLFSVLADSIKRHA